MKPVPPMKRIRSGDWVGRAVRAGTISSARSGNPIASAPYAAADRPTKSLLVVFMWYSLGNLTHSAPLALEQWQERLVALHRRAPR